jgi:hypothetical protein
LVSFTLLSVFSGAAISGTVHKCLQANGRYEFTDKKCVPVTPSAVQEQAAPVTSSSGNEANPADPQSAARVSAPLEVQPEQAPNSSAVPSAPQPNTTLPLNFRLPRMPQIAFG